MTRLDDVIERNETQQRRTRRLIWKVVIGIVLVIVALVLAFTGLGMPKPLPAHEKRVDGVLLRSK